MNEKKNLVIILRKIIKGDYSQEVLKAYSKTMLKIKGKKTRGMENNKKELAW